jgi:hypothetical protein
MKPIQIHPPCPNDATRTPLLPQSAKADKVFEDADPAECRGDDAEDGVGAQVGVVPEAEVEDDGHGDGVDEDERPEDEDGELAGVESVVEGWGFGLVW